VDHRGISRHPFPTPRETFIPIRGESIHRVKRMKVCPDIAKLTKGQLKKVQDLEEELGVVIVAHERMPVLSDLSREELKTLKDTEKKMGMTLVAYRRE
jgi:hypothetical protein